MDTGPYTHCDRCSAPKPSNWVLYEGRRFALCFNCWNPIRSDCKMLAYINKLGRIQA